MTEETTSTLWDQCKSLAQMLEKYSKTTLRLYLANRIVMGAFFRGGGDSIPDAIKTEINGLDDWATTGRDINRINRLNARLERLKDDGQPRRRRRKKLTAHRLSATEKRS